MKYERITTADVQVGDSIARARTDNFITVTQIDEGPVSRRLHGTYTRDVVWSDGRVYAKAGANAGNIRPRRDIKLWKEVG